MKSYRFTFFSIVLFLSFMLMISTISYAGSYAGTGEDMQEIKKGLSEVKEELKEIKRLLESPRPQAPTTPPAPALTESEASIDDDPILGKKNAPITIIEFSDYQCPFCARFSRDTLPQIKKDYIDKGIVRYVFRDYPLSSIHPRAQMAAEAAQCAGDQGKYWEMHDTLFDNQRALEVEDLKEYAEDLDLNIKSFNECLDKAKYVREVKDDIKSGENAGVQGTPAFIVGKTTENGVIKGKFIKGAHPYQTFKTAIEELLKSTP